MLLSTAEAATRLGIIPRRVQALITAGKLPAQRVGRSWVIQEADLAMVADRKEGWPKGRPRTKSGDTEMGFITLAGHKMKIDYDMVDVPCLGGEDVTRERSRILITARKGEPLGLGDSFDAPLEIRGTETLIGWGDLDGPAYEIGAVEHVWTVSVPCALIDALLAWSGGSIERAATA